MTAARIRFLLFDIVRPLLRGLAARGPWLHGQSNDKTGTERLVSRLPASPRGGLGGGEGPRGGLASRTNRDFQRGAGAGRFDELDDVLAVIHTLDHDPGVLDGGPSGPGSHLSKADGDQTCRIEAQHD